MYAADGSKKKSEGNACLLNLQRCHYSDQVSGYYHNSYHSSFLHYNIWLKFYSAAAFPSGRALVAPALLLVLRGRVAVPLGLLVPLGLVLGLLGLLGGLGALRLGDGLRGLRGGEKRECHEHNQVYLIGFDLP